MLLPKTQLLLVGTSILRIHLPDAAADHSHQNIFCVQAHEFAVSNLEYLSPH